MNTNCKNTNKSIVATTKVRVIRIVKNTAEFYI